jgi:hypothetical protein
MTPDNDPLISYLDVVPLLIAACPTYKGSPQAIEADPDDGEYLLAGHFVAHLIQSLQEGITGSFPAVFAVVEWVLTEGDDEAQSLITEGFLDDLCNPEFHSGTTTRPEDFLHWLGPRTRRCLPTDPGPW